MRMRGIRLKYLLAPIFVLWLVGVGVAVIAATTPTAAAMMIAPAYKDRPLPPTPALIVRKTTNGMYAPKPPGPRLQVGESQYVTWTYTITNTGEVAVEEIELVDFPEGGFFTNSSFCDPQTTVLAPSRSIVCINNTEYVTFGQYVNVVTVTAVSAMNPSQRVVITDVSHYFGQVAANAGITLTKYTNGIDVSAPPGPDLEIGDPVTWTYRITNTGDIRLTNISLVDVSAQMTTVVSSCASHGLAGGASTTCQLIGRVAAGAYNNTATVTGQTDTDMTVSATDNSYYFGKPKLGITAVSKQVAPVIADVGEVVTYTLIVTGLAAAQPVMLAITDTLPAALRTEAGSVIATLGAATLAPATNTLHWTYTTTVGITDTATITYKARITTQCPTTTLTNQAHLFVDGMDAGQAAATVTLKSAPKCDVFLPVVAKPVEQLPALVNGYLDATPEGLGWSQTITTKLIQDAAGDLIYADDDPFAALSKPNYAWLGGARDQTNQLRQTLPATLPTVYTVTVQFCYRLESAEPAAGNDYVEIRAGEKTTPDAADNRQRIDLHAGAATPGQQWKRASVSLDALKGEIVTIEFFSSLNGSLNSNFLVDNVKLCVPVAVPGSNAPVCATEEFCSPATAAAEASNLVMERP